MNFYEFVMERTFVPKIATKGSWGFITANQDKTEFSDELVSLVSNAYKQTSQGSFVNELKDVLPSDWLSIDFDEDPNIDATIFYRKARVNEPWSGNKIQGIGHDGSRVAINKVMDKLQNLLNNNTEWWVEASGALEHVLYKRGVKYLALESRLRRIFNDSSLQMVGDRGKYTRTLPNGIAIIETVFGEPKLSIT